MVWLKRLLPFLVLAGAWAGYDYYREQQWAEEVSRTEQIARVTAELWVANARLRPDSAAFLAYRDSVLTAENLSVDTIREFTTRIERDPARYDTFAVMLTRYIDSLITRTSDSIGVDTVLPQARD